MPSRFVRANWKYFADPAPLGFEEAYKEVSGWLRESILSSGRVSTLLRCQLAELLRWRILEVHYIYDAIAANEGKKDRGKTGPANDFSGPILKGLRKKHFYDDNFIPKNLANFAGSSKGKKFHESFWPDRIGQDVTDAADEYFLGMIAHGYLSKLEERSLTGEWIVFTNIDGINYYLTLATHKLPQERTRLLPNRKVDADLAILFNVCLCAEEFPELLNLPLFQ